MSGYLLADIGGTHTRVALATPGQPPYGVRRYRNAELTSPTAALAARLAEADATAVVSGKRLIVAAAVAGPIRDQHVQLTNIDWELSASTLAQATGAHRAVLVNDYQALARALPELPATATTPIFQGQSDSAGALAVLGPGTGLGVAGALPTPWGWGVISGEGGHVTLAAADDEETALLAALRAEQGHVSAEDLLCGSGLARLHRQLHGVTLPPEAITAAAQREEPPARQTLDLFMRFLGTTAGNLALTLGATGGLYFAGGILAQLGAAAVACSRCRERFISKGRFRAYLDPIPIHLIDDPAGAALLGLRAWLDDRRDTLQTTASSQPDSAPPPNARHAPSTPPDQGSERR
ncbi:ROK family protein [Halorhodospira abdelmalekii]|uniref:ROK family protein n=1 Tax=Halorhodospira abdelmalekii TaxID=421629 RepID=UPI0019054F8D